MNSIRPLMEMRPRDRANTSTVIPSPISPTWAIPANAVHTISMALLSTVVCCWMIVGDVPRLQAQAASGEVTVYLLNGSMLRGEIVAIEAQRVSLRTSEGVVDKPANELSRILFSNKPNIASDAIEVSLVDGSKVYGRRLVGGAAGWKLSTGANSELELLPKTMRAARLRPIPNALLTNWQSAIKEPAESDALIVMRGAESLDRINGIIVQVQETSVSFELDGQAIEIPIEKLAGLIWFQRSEARVRPSVEINATDGAAWLADSIQWKANALEIKTQAGQSVSLPASTLTSINYASANIKWVSELETLEAVADKRVDFKSMVPGLERAMTPRFVLNGRTPDPGSSSGDQDLYFPCPGAFVFRVPDGFTSFQSQVLRTDVGNLRSDLTLEIWQEDQRLTQQSLPFDQDSVEISANLQPGKRTKLVVVGASKLMVGTEVQWKQPRLKR
jgi:hypothetical protein